MALQKDQQKVQIPGQSTPFRYTRRAHRWTVRAPLRQGRTLGGGLHKV